MTVFPIDRGIILIMSVSSLDEKLGASYHIVSISSFEIRRFSDVADRRHYIANTFANSVEGVLLVDRGVGVGDL